MSSTSLWCLLLVFVLCLCVEVNEAKGKGKLNSKEAAALKRKEIYCGACLAMAEEISLDIAGTDKKKKIEVGSFRIRPDGKQDLKQINYRQSETHMVEVLETVCGKMRIFGLRPDEETGHKNYIRRISLDGTPVSERGMDVSDRIYENLLYACNAILEEHEDEVMAVFRKQGGLDELSKELCTETLGMCKEENVTEKLWATANAIMEGMKLKTQPKMDAMFAEEEERRRREGGDDYEDEDDFDLRALEEDEAGDGLENVDVDGDVSPIPPQPEEPAIKDPRIIASREIVEKIERPRRRKPKVKVNPEGGEDGAAGGEAGAAESASAGKEEL